jgi:hypothetical protein
MMTEKSTNRPRSEPEIIPPSNQPFSGVWVSQAERGSYRFHVTRPGPFGIILLAAVVGAILTLALVLLLGFVLIWIPVTAALIAIGIACAFLRGIFNANK